MTRGQALILSALGSIGVGLLWLVAIAWILFVFGMDIEYEQREQGWLRLCALGFTCVGVLQAALARLPFSRALLWVMWQVVSLAALVNLFPANWWTTLALGLLSPMALQLPLVLLANGAAHWKTYTAPSFVIWTSIWAALMPSLLWLNATLFSEYSVACYLLGFLLPLRDVGLIVISAGHPQERASLPLRWFGISASVTLLLAVGCSSGALLSHTSRMTPLAFRRVDRVRQCLITSASDTAFYYFGRGPDRNNPRVTSIPPFESELERMHYEARQVWYVAVRIDPQLSPQWTQAGAFESRDDHHLGPADFRLPPLDGWLADLEGLIDSLLGRNLRAVRHEDREEFVPREWGEFNETPVTIRRKSGHPFRDYLRTVYPKHGVVLMVVYK